MYIVFSVATRFDGMGNLQAKNCLKTHKMVVHNCVLVIEFLGITRTDIWTTVKKKKTKMQKHVQEPHVTSSLPH